MKLFFFLRKLDASREKGIRGERAIALMSVTANLYSSVVVQMLKDTWGAEEMATFARGRRKR